MAVTQNPHIGRSRNSFSTAIFSKWKDKNTMRSKPSEVANPNTVAQQKQRGAFKVTQDVGVRSLDIHKIGFNSKMSTMTGLNAFVQANVNQSVTADAAANIAIDFEALVYSIGNLTPTEFDCNGQTNSQFNISWDNHANTWADDQRADDQLNYVMLEVKDGAIIASQYGLNQGARSSSGKTVELRESKTTGSTIYVYPFFAAIARNKVEPNTFYTPTT